MALLGNILKNSAKLGAKKIKYLSHQDGIFAQEKVLKELIKTAEKTAFGQNYQFASILQSKNFIQAFQETVPAYEYNTIYKDWWSKTIKGKADICWPGKINYFALSSGTSEASSKQIPVTKDMINAIRRVGLHQLMCLSDYKLPASFYEKQILMLGGSIQLNVLDKSRYEGDLSGILAGNLPSWLYHFYKPGKEIAKEKDWNEKLNKIVQVAKDWDVGIICGVPAWIQILIERIISHYHISTIHEIWPNFKFLVHGGVAFGPYKKGLEKLFSQPVNYLETYLASEGFLAYQTPRNKNSMQLVLNNDVFFEFIPFTEKNFSANGEINVNPEAFTLKQVKEGTEYAILISTCAGAWRYLIGDTIKFTSVEKNEIIITGRTKHFLSLCGEHLSVDNMTMAIDQVSKTFNVDVKEFTVTGIPYQNLFAHKWYIGTDQKIDNIPAFKEKLDTTLKALNDDYKTERKAALKEVIIENIPNSFFYEWLKINNKEGGQHKFPRVIKGERLKDWEQFLLHKKNSISV